MTGPTEPRTIAPLAQPFHRRVAVSGSKSLAARALAAAALSEGRSVVRGTLDAEDVAVLVRGLQALGVPVEWDGSRVRVTGLPRGARFPARGVTMDAGLAGFPARLLVALAALSDGPVTVTGAPRMADRPMRPLAEALRALGCPVRCLGDGLPMEIAGSGLRGGSIALKGSAASSQFLSSLALALTRADGPSLITLDEPLVSAPYANMTIAVARRFGLRIEAAEAAIWRVEPGAGRAAEFDVEPDASSAGYAFAAAALTAGEATVPGLFRTSGQPDLALLDVLERMGCRVSEGPEGVTVRGGPLRGVRAELGGSPDSVPALVAVAVFAHGATEIRGVAHLRFKESDRIASLIGELGRLGARLEELPDGLIVHGAEAASASGALHGGTVDPHGDHRIAMAAALVGLRVPGVRVKDPGCVAKSFPGFWTEIMGEAARA